MVGDCPGRGGANSGGGADPGQSADDRCGDNRHSSGGNRQDATKPDAAQPAIVPGSVGHAIPTPGIGEPDSRKGIQYQVTPIGRKPRPSTMAR